MWSLDQITIEIELADHPTALISIATPKGIIRLLVSVSMSGRVMRIDDAHVGGLEAGEIGRAGLNAIGRKLLEEADVEEIIIQGATRTSGKYRGKRPHPIRFPRCKADAGS